MSFSNLDCIDTDVAVGPPPSYNTLQSPVQLETNSLLQEKESQWVSSTVQVWLPVTDVVAVGVQIFTSLFNLSLTVRYWTEMIVHEESSNLVPAMVITGGKEIAERIPPTIKQTMMQKITLPFWVVGLGLAPSLRSACLEASASWFDVGWSGSCSSTVVGATISMFDCLLPQLLVQFAPIVKQ